MTLRAKILSLMLLLTAAPLVALGAWGVSWLVRDKEAYAFELVSQATADAARGVERRAQDVAHTAQVVALGAAQQALAGGKPEEAFQGSGLVALSLLDGGRALVELHLAGSPPEAQAAAEEAARRAPADGKPLVSAVSGLKAGPPLVVVARLIAPTRAVGAVVRAEDLFAAPKGGLYVGWLVDFAGRALWHPDPAAIQRDLSGTVPVRAMAELPAGTVATREAEIDGARMLAASARTQAGPGVVLMVPQEAAAGPVRAVARRGAALVLIVLVLAVAVAATFSSRLGRRLAALGESAQAIAHGDFDAPAPPPGPSDELGALASAFARMQKDLQERDQHLEEAREQLVQSEKLSALGALAASVSHEIKNPLTGIMGMAQLALKEIPESSKAHAQVERIFSEGRRSKEILNNLLKFSRREEVQYVEVDVNACVQEAWQLCAHQMHMHKVKLSAELTEGLPRIRGNANQLVQVLLNLMLNAEHAMRPKGGKLRIASARQGEQVVIEVRDEGVGIAPEDLGKLFTPFFSTKARGEGTGLGLSVSHGLVQQHGGSIKVWSEVGVGSAFYVYLPALVPPALPRRITAG